MTAPFFHGRDMFFSVIVPVYNVGPYLRQCLDSLAGQTCRDMEIIAVDDGSTDGSGAVCDEYEERYDFFTAIHQENQGLSAARNAGMAQAQGEWLSFVDGDDWVEPDMLELLQGHILASKADLYRLSYDTVDEAGMVTSENISAEGDTVIEFPDEKSRFRFYYDFFMGSVRVWGGAYRAAIIRENGLTFVDTQQIYAEDLLFNFQYMLNAGKIVYLRDVMYYYRKREGSLTDITCFADRLSRVAELGELAFKSVEAEELPFFQREFYQIYFKLLNRFIVRDAVDVDDVQLKKMLDALCEYPHYLGWMKQIRRRGARFRKYTAGRPWYREDFASAAYLRRRARRNSLFKDPQSHSLAWRFLLFGQNMRYLVRRTTAFEPVFFRDSKRRVAYLSNSKAACSAISASMLGREDIPDDYTVFPLRKRYCTSQPVTWEGWYSFTFVRNPFARLVSCYESKFHTDQTKNRKAMARRSLDFDHYLHGYMKRDPSFPEFVEQVVSIPWRLDNNHFCSQYRKIVEKDGKPKVDFIGRFENLEEEYKPIQEKYGFAPLKVYNKSEHGDWRDYYTTDLAKKVYSKYKKDVKYFGYEQDYRDLLAYCREKERRS